jgi:hypothetical protein
MLTKPSVLARQLPELKKFAIFAKVEIGEFQGRRSDWPVRTDDWMAQHFALTGTGLVEGGMAVRVEADRWLLASTSAGPEPAGGRRSSGGGWKSKPVSPSGSGSSGGVHPPDAEPASP